MFIGWLPMPVVLKVGLALQKSKENDPVLTTKEVCAVSASLRVLLTTIQLPSHAFTLPEASSAAQCQGLLALGGTCLESSTIGDLYIAAK